MPNKNSNEESYIVITDDRLFNFNHGKGDNEEKSLNYKDSNGILRSIVFDVCAKNFHDYSPNSNRNCVAERNIQDYSFTFYTSGVLTKVIFKKRYYFNLRFTKLFNGSRMTRFEKLRKMIEDTGYTSRDLS